MERANNVEHDQHLGHGRIAPEAQLVLAEAVAGEQLPLVLVPGQSTHLHETGTRGLVKEITAVASQHVVTMQPSC